MKKDIDGERYMQMGRDIDIYGERDTAEVQMDRDILYTVQQMERDVDGEIF